MLYQNILYDFLNKNARKRFFNVFTELFKYICSSKYIFMVKPYFFFVFFLFSGFTSSLFAQYGACVPAMSDVQPLSIVAEPTPTVVGNDILICRGDTLRLTASGGDLDFRWNTAKKETTASITIKPTQDSSYTVRSKMRIGNNLVVNGDFEQGNIGFSSAYIYKEFGDIWQGSYGIRDNPKTGNHSWATCGDHTTGSGMMLVADGASGYQGVPAGAQLWCQEIPVEYGKEYAFSAYLTGIVPPSSSLKFEINGIDLGTSPVLSSDMCEWSEFFVTWTPPNESVTTAMICLSEGTGVGFNNDFALDDVSFYELCDTETSITVKLNDIKIESIDAQAVSCKNAQDGQLSIVPTGGLMPYWTKLDNSDFANMLVYSSLTPGKHDITLKDAMGCQAQATINIDEATSLLAVELVSMVNYACPENTTGNATVEVVASGGQAPYSYQWPNGATTAQVTGLPLGTHKLTVMDSFFCKKEIEVTVVSNPAITITTEAIQHVSCYDGNNGSIEVSVSGGVPKSGQQDFYKYSWTGPQIGEQDTLSKLSSLKKGFYTLTVTDWFGCSTWKDFLITQPDSIKIESVESLTKNTSCYGKQDGSLTVQVTGGVEPYNYLWEDGTTTSERKNMFADTLYKVLITDGNKCEKTAFFSVSQPDELIASISQQTEVSCFGATNGTASVVALGGTFPYTYSWSDGNNQTTSTASDLPAGDYIVTVTDTNLCVDTVQVTITGPDMLTVQMVSKENVVCYGDSSGKVTVVATGGNAPYVYNWSNGLFGATISGLPAGGYTVSAIDNKGCVSSAQIAIEQPNKMEINHNQLVVEHVSCAGKEDGLISIEVQGGVPPYNYTWGQGKTSHIITNLPQGSYTVEIKDQVNCSIQRTFTVTEPAPLKLNLTAEKMILCPDQSTLIHASYTGGVQPISIDWGNAINTWTHVANPKQDTVYQAVISDGHACTDLATIAIQVSELPKAIFDDHMLQVCVGTTVSLTSLDTKESDVCTWTFSDGTVIANQCGTIYHPITTLGFQDVTLLVVNSNGCFASHTGYHMIYALPQPVADFKTDKTSYSTLDAEVIFTNLSQNATSYIWDFGDDSPLITDPNPIHAYLSNAQKTHTVTLIAQSSNGMALCADTISKYITVNEQQLFFLPNSFTPNRDGRNELFMPVITSGVNPDHYLFEVYNRWGEKVFETTSIFEGWDGTYKGQIERQDMYLWRIQVQERQSVKRVIYTGHVSVLP